MAASWENRCKSPCVSGWQSTSKMKSCGDFAVPCLLVLHQWCHQKISSLQNSAVSVFAEVQAFHAVTSSGVKGAVGVSQKSGLPWGRLERRLLPFQFCFQSAARSLLARGFRCRVLHAQHSSLRGPSWSAGRGAQRHPLCTPLLAPPVVRAANWYVLGLRTLGFSDPPSTEQHKLAQNFRTPTTGPRTCQFPKKLLSFVLLF